MVGSRGWGGGGEGRPLYQKRPAYSPRSASSSGFRVKVLVEQNQLVPVLVRCVSLLVSVTGPVAEFVWEKN